MKKLILSATILLNSCISVHDNDTIEWDSFKVESKKEQTEVVPNLPEEISSNKILLELHNKERKKRNLPEYKLDDFLCKYAQEHAEWMARKNSLQHSNIRKLMSDYSTVGENIGFNQSDENEIVSDWMNSNGHRANILNKSFSKIGFGVALDKEGRKYWCTCFGD